MSCDAGASGHNLVAVEIGYDGATVFLVSRILPAPRTGIPVVLAAHARRVEHRHAFLVTFIDERADIGQRFPGVFAAGIAPTLNRFEDRLRTVAAECPVHINNEERRPLPKPAPRTVARRSETALSRSVRNSLQIVMLTTHEAASYLRLSPRTLERLRVIAP